MQNLSEASTWEPKSLMDWLVSFRDPREIWRYHPTYLMLEVVAISFALINLCHALKNGGRYPWLWITTVFHGITVELLSYCLNDIDSFWHSQSTIVFFQKRFPLHIVLFYPFIIYTATVVVSRLRLPRLAHCCAAGLGVVLIDVPFDILGIKHLWWTWHDTDPNIYDRHYWVPWNSYYFHASFAFSLNFIFFGLHSKLSGTPPFQSRSWWRELVVSIVTGLFSMPMGCLQFIPVYHYFHDIHQVHTEVCVVVFLTAYFLCYWSADRQPAPEARPKDPRLRKVAPRWFDEQLLIIVLHYTFYLYLVFFRSDTENIVNIGLKEPLGPCDETMDVLTVTGRTLKKRRYLCVSDMDEDYQDFHCLPGSQAPSLVGANWYTNCGTPTANPAECQFVISAACGLGLFVYYHWIKRSGSLPPGKLTKAKAH